MPVAAITVTPSHVSDYRLHVISFPCIPTIAALRGEKVFQSAVPLGGACDAREVAGDGVRPVETNLSVRKASL
jgi:hypothetical protein